MKITAIPAIPPIMSVLSPPPFDGSLFLACGGFEGVSSRLEVNLAATWHHDWSNKEAGQPAGNVTFSLHTPTTT